MPRYRRTNEKPADGGDQIGHATAGTNDPLLEKLAEIRASGDPKLIEIVTRVIEATKGILQHGLRDEDIEALKAAKQRQARR